MDSAVYLDYNATTPVDPRVVLAMMPYLREQFGNASSAHSYGYPAHAALVTARSRVARLVGAKPSEIVFTGGASETNNLSIKGAVFARFPRPAHIVSTVIEHPAVLNTLAYLQSRFSVAHTLVPVDVSGRVDPDEIRSAIRSETVLISVMHANNEVGTLQPIRAIGGIAREAGVLFHVDAAQSAGKIPLDVEGDSVDLLSIAGHKLYAPKGVGALYIRQGAAIDPLIHGSGQEGGIRAGTENIPGTVAMGVACELALNELADESHRLTWLRDRLEQRLRDGIPGLELNGHPLERLPNTLNVSFPHVTGQAVLALGPDVAASTGSACHSSQPEPSPVLLAMGLSPERAIGAVRLSLGRMSTEAEIDRAGDCLVNAYRQLIPAREGSLSA